MSLFEDSAPSRYPGELYPCPDERCTHPDCGRVVHTSESDDWEEEEEEDPPDLEEPDYDYWLDKTYPRYVDISDRFYPR